jgi:hypothetical protein
MITMSSVNEFISYSVFFIIEIVVKYIKALMFVILNVLYLEQKKFNTFKFCSKNFSQNINTIIAVTIAPLMTQSLQSKHMTLY